MDKRQDGRSRPSHTSRLNKRMQVLEEHLANTNKELRKLSEVVGSKVDTNELFSYVGRTVSVVDVTGGFTEGELKKIGKWTLSIDVEGIADPVIFFKGNLVRVTPKGK